MIPSAKLEKEITKSLRFVVIVMATIMSLVQCSPLLLEAGPVWEGSGAAVLPWAAAEEVYLCATVYSPAPCSFAHSPQSTRRKPGWEKGLHVDVFACPLKTVELEMSREELK